MTNHETSSVDMQSVNNGLVFDPASTPDEEKQLLDQLPSPGSEVMVVRSLRLPLDVDEQVTAAAHDAGVAKTVWMRQIIEAALDDRRDDDRVIRLADAKRALTLLRSNAA